MTHLKNAPLIYTIGVIKFPKIPGIERFIDSFQDKIRGEYPFREEVSSPMLNVDLDSQGLQFTQNEDRIWQFAVVDRKWAFVLTDQSFCLHTIDYRDFVDFSRRFQKGLEALLEISEIGIKWLTMVGMRYVNLIEAGQDKKVYDYVKKWALPGNWDQKLLTTIESAHLTRYKTDIGELRLQALLNPQITLPLDLRSPLIYKNEWIKSPPKRDFAILDIDHSITFTPPSEMESVKVLDCLSDLRNISKEIFLSLGTELAYKVWSEK
jgi:uncharacterized protein (TIGR04255 family)